MSDSNDSVECNDNECYICTDKTENKCKCRCKNVYVCRECETECVRKFGVRCRTCLGSQINGLSVWMKMYYVVLPNTHEIFVINNLIFDLVFLFYILQIIVNAVCGLFFRFSDLVFINPIYAFTMLPIVFFYRICANAALLFGRPAE